MPLGLALLVTLALEGLAQVRNLGREAVEPLRNGFEFQCNLAALSAEGLRLGRGGGHLCPQPLLFAVHARQPLLGLRELIAEIGSGADRFQNGRAIRFLLAVPEPQDGPQRPPFPAG